MNTLKQWVNVILTERDRQEAEQATKRRQKALQEAEEHKEWTRRVLRLWNVPSQILDAPYCLWTDKGYLQIGRGCFCGGKEGRVLFGSEGTITFYTVEEFASWLRQELEWMETESAFADDKTDM